MHTDADASSVFRRIITLPPSVERSALSLSHAISTYIYPVFNNTRFSLRNPGRIKESTYLIYPPSSHRIEGFPSFGHRQLFRQSGISNHEQRVGYEKFWPQQNGPHNRHKRLYSLTHRLPIPIPWFSCSRHCARSLKGGQHQAGSRDPPRSFQG